MTDFNLAGTSAPWVVFVPKGSVEVRQQLAALEERGGRVHHFAASDLATEQSVYRVFAETLKFPGYFGRNWDAMVDCLDDLCGAVTGGQVGIAGVITGTDDRLLEAEHFPDFVSVLCLAADRANSAVDLDGDSLDRPAIAEHFVFECGEFDREMQERVVRRVEQPDLIVTRGEGFVGAALDPDEWH
ncbi:barstar family protein [Streptomyces atriruber]|uniref:barstar family protein n=1 Tax=Streptomyces atriruber TaxID=545121 RepID=UPI0006E372B4|nr:barstar family protein [Streptomyces atriruber]